MLGCSSDVVFRNHIKQLFKSKGSKGRMFKNLNEKRTDKFRMQADDFLTPYEVEHLTNSLEEIPIERFGSPE